MNRIKSCLTALMLVLWVVMPADSIFAADDSFYLDFEFNSQNTFDSTRKDFNELLYDNNASEPRFVAKQYDKSFLNTNSDMFFAVRGDLNETQFLDIKETLGLIHYNEEDYYSRAKNGRKLKELDHELNVTYGIAAGDHDFFQLDYFNNYYDVAEFKEWQIRSNKAAGLFCHEFSQKAILAVTGAYEEREYEFDPVADYKQGTVGFEVAGYIGGKTRFVPVAASARGDRSYFENFPNGLSARKAVDYYTDWTRNPHDTDPGAKYQKIKARGDLFLRLYADAHAQERGNLDNRSSGGGIGLEASYELADNMVFRLNNYYQKKDWKNESRVNFLFDHYANILSLSATWYTNENLQQTFCFTDELVDNNNFSNENHRTNILKYSGSFYADSSWLFVNAQALRRRFDQNRSFYSDEDEISLSGGWHYNITDQIKFKLRSEYVDADYNNFENLYLASFIRTSWRAGIEKRLSLNHSLEVAYQENSENFENFNGNNISEKSFNFSWLMHF
ncbi:MAG: hypothetical protein ACQETH_01480 [Candidatus Rifleibacteriota bacterium]